MDYIESFFNIILLGDSCVGKTSILDRYIDNSFSVNTTITSRTVLKIKNVKMEDGSIIRIQIRDTPGIGRFRFVSKEFYKGSDGVILIYSITDRSSFENLSNWIKEIKDEILLNTPIFLVGNKIDNEEHEAVSQEEGEIFAKENGLIFFECSAKNGLNIENIFNALIKIIYENQLLIQRQMEEEIKIKEEEKRKVEEEIKRKEEEKRKVEEEIKKRKRKKGKKMILKEKNLKKQILMFF